MKYFSTKGIWGKEKKDYIRLAYGIANQDDYRIFSIKKEENKIRFREECDQFFTVNMTKEDAIEMLQEAIDWIKNA